MCWTGTLQRAFVGKCCLQQGRVPPFCLPLFLSPSLRLCLATFVYIHHNGNALYRPSSHSSSTSLFTRDFTLGTRAGPQPNGGPQHDCQASPRFASHLMVHHGASRCFKSQIQSPPLHTWGPIHCVLCMGGGGGTFLHSLLQQGVVDGAHSSI